MSADGKTDEALLKRVAIETTKPGSLSSSSGNRSLRNLKANFRSRPSAAIGAAKCAGIIDLNFQSLVIRVTQSFT